MASDFPSASLIEEARFNQAVVLPNALQGLFKRRRTPTGVATRLDVDGQGVGLLRGMRKSHGPGPLWVHLVKDRALLLLDVADVSRALDGSPQPFAADPGAKRKGMAHFQPDALTLSRGELWADRRRFAEAVLDTPQVTHRLGDRFVAIVAEELDALNAEAPDEPLDYDGLHRAYSRITRRIVLGDAARDDEQISELLAELMSQANTLPSDRSDEFEPFSERVAAYVAAGQEGSLAGIAAGVDATPDTRVDGQLTHWLFAMQDTLSANALRALALVATHAQTAAVDEDLTVEPSSAAAVAGMSRLRATLLEAMRLWPTTPLLSRELLSEVVWHGVRVPKGTQVVIPNTFHHRDPERLGDAADRFTPDGWLEGGTFGDDQGLNFFSHGPQVCPGANLALLLGVATMANILRRSGLVLEGPKLRPEKPLPHMFDVFAIKLEQTAG